MLRFYISTLFEKSNFFPKIQFWQNPNIFTSFSTKIFWQFFSWNQSCQQLKSPKPQHFHEFFVPKNRQFYRKFKVEFLDKKWRFRTVFFFNLPKSLSRIGIILRLVEILLIGHGNGQQCGSQNDFDHLEKENSPMKILNYEKRGRGKIR